MSTIDLIILGIISEHPMNAYELTRYIEEKSINKLLKISNPSIYKSSKRLYKSGYFKGKTIRDGELPEKVVYSINKKGKDYFYKLMKQYSSEIKPFYLECNTFLWNIGKLKKEEGMNMLKNLQNSLLLFKDWIIKHEQENLLNAPFASRMIIKQYRMILFTLVQWIEETIQEYKLNFSYYYILIFFVSVL